MNTKTLAEELRDIHTTNQDKDETLEHVLLLVAKQCKAEATRGVRRAEFSPWWLSCAAHGTVLDIPRLAKALCEKPYEVTAHVESDENDYPYLVVEW